MAKDSLVFMSGELRLVHKNEQQPTSKLPQSIIDKK